MQAPSHRILALFRGADAGLLRVHVLPEDDTDCIGALQQQFVRTDNESSLQVAVAVSDAYKRLLAPSIETEYYNLLKEKAKSGIFLSVLDVHVNRAPCRMTVRFVRHQDGSYHDARDPRAIKENESLVLGGTGKVCGKEFPMAVKQISGAIARRIVCRAEPGSEFEKGYCYGMIKFGSRTELYLPVKSGFEPAVNVGDRVFGGETVIARYHQPQE